MVQHPPPLNYLNALILPFVFCREKFDNIARYFSFLMYWIENCVFMSAFIVYELLILPLVYLKTIFNMFSVSSGILKTMLNVVLWIIGGLFVDLWFVALDAYYLFRVLSMFKGCREGMKNELEELELGLNKRIELYNEVRKTIICLYKELMKAQKA